MTDNDTPSTFPRFHLPDRLKLGLQGLRLEALESLQNLRVFEYTGLTLSQDCTFVLGPTPTSDDWATTHRSTLENLLRVIIEYYRRLHGDTVLKVALLQIMELDLPEFPVHPDRFTFKGYTRVDRAESYRISSRHPCSGNAECGPAGGSDI
jgi:hypothetical protein